VRPSALARLRSALVAGLYRRLADDDDRAAYWVRHVRHGILLSEVAGAFVVGYVLFTDTPGRHDPVLLALAILAMLGCPLLLALPLRAMMRDSRGPTMFYLWSLAMTVLILIGTTRDGGSGSPLDALLFLTLTYMAVAYPPHGVVAMGASMCVGYFLVVLLPGLTTSGVFFLAVMLAFTMICAMASANSWAASDRQLLLIRAQQSLAATDELTGGPNRRAFLDRLGSTLAGGPGAFVVCLVDLDGFKAVNDLDGHLAGDAVLVDVARALASAVRTTDAVARLGGDEFAVIAEVGPDLPEHVLAERLRAAVADVGAARGVTASVGLAAVLPGDDVEAVLHRADQAMYRAKSAGGDRVDLPRPLADAPAGRC
jgi:diguanylate cyclase (GGDEF)-like protein